MLNVLNSFEIESIYNSLISTSLPQKIGQTEEVQSKLKKKAMAYCNVSVKKDLRCKRLQKYLWFIQYWKEYDKKFLIFIIMYFNNLDRREQSLAKLMKTNP